MPITANSMQNTPYQFGNFSGFNVPKLRNEHSEFDYSLTRVNYATVPLGNGLEMVNYTKAANGDTIYLSYFTNEISSVRLPIPPPAGVTTFTTDNLSGCKFFVDRIVGSDDLMVYHANARLHAPISNLGATQPATESLAARNHLDGLHTRARNDYFSTPPHLQFANGASLDKPTYNQQADLEVQRKVVQGRSRIPNPNEAPDPNRSNSPEFLGGTVIFGFYVPTPLRIVPGEWRFYYQTWGAVEYRRPATAPKGWVQGGDKPGGNMRVLSCAQFF
jgi:hypothetical protein